MPPARRAPRDAHRGDRLVSLQAYRGRGGSGRSLAPWLILPAVLVFALGLAVTRLPQGSLPTLGRPEAAPATAPAAPAWQGRVVGVTDGDTLTVLDQGRRQVRIRMAEIDAPERRQPWGTRSRQLLSDLVFAQTVDVRATGADRYGRTLARVYVGGVDVNAEMVRQGGAWAYRQYQTDPAIPRLEAQARAQRRGLWSSPPQERTPPWDWRAARRRGEDAAVPELLPAAAEAPPAPAGAAVPASMAACGPKRYCREMSSCAEARRYLEVCGLTRLDGDGDGAPCEALCR